MTESQERKKSEKKQEARAKEENTQQELHEYNN